jgi:hypothetical protein
MARKIGAIIILFLLLVVPFLNWRIGAILWMSAWLTYIFQGLAKGWAFRGKKKDDPDGG